MHIVDIPDGSTTIVVPVGRIDSTTASDLEAHVMALLDGGALRLILDLSGVEYISSAGLRVLLLVARRLRDRRGALALCGLNDAVTQVFELAGFIQLFSIRPSRDAARQALG